MSLTDILLPQTTVSASISRTKLTALLPITLALVGVAAILLGGVSTRATSAESGLTAGIDPIITGAIGTSPDQRRALQMLDD